MPGGTFVPEKSLCCYKRRVLAASYVVKRKIFLAVKQVICGKSLPCVRFYESARQMFVSKTISQLIILKLLLDNLLMS